MKLEKFPTDLPIEAIGDVIKILGIFIAMVKDKSFFFGSDNFPDYNETMRNLRRDLNDCFDLYEIWQYEPNASEFEEALTKMHAYLEEASSLLKKANQSLH